MLLDGVFVLTRDAALRHRWRRRIERNLLQLRVQAKPCECASAHVSGEQQTIAFADVELRMGTGEPCDLGGVRPVKIKVISPGDVRTRRDAARLAGE